MSVKIYKSSNYIKYDDNIDIWEGDIIFNVTKYCVDIYGTSRELNDTERSIIITEILNRYAFGSYLDREEDIYMSKLRNRGLEKYEELGLEEKYSYSMLGETIIELKENEDECDAIKSLRNIYLNLKISAKEIEKGYRLRDILVFNVDSNSIEYNKLKKILLFLVPEFETGLSNITKRNMEIKVLDNKYSKRNQLFCIRLREAN